MGDENCLDPRIEVLLATLIAIASCRRSDITVRNAARAWDFAIRAHLVSKDGREFCAEEVFSELNSFCDDSGPSPELICLLRMNFATAFGLEKTNHLCEQHQVVAKEVIWIAIETVRHFTEPATEQRPAITA